MNSIMTQLQALIDGNCKALFLHPEGVLQPYPDDTYYDGYRYGSHYVLPTAADPLHKGHLHMANHVSSIRDIDGCVEFELSICNVDKPDLSVEEVYHRIQQFIKLGRRCWITRFATFAQKAYFFKECQFIIGTDTANRIVSPDYYFDCEEERDKVMDNIFDQHCTFMVLGRPGYLLDHYCFEQTHLFFIEEYKGHEISSTEIREDLRNYPNENILGQYTSPTTIVKPHLYAPVDELEFGGASKPQFFD